MLIYEDQVVVYLYPPILFRLRYKNIYYVNHIVRTGVYFYNIYRLTHIYKYDMIYIREITVHISHWARSHWALLEGLELELRALLEGLEFELRGLLLIGRGFESWLRGRWNEPLPAIEPWLQWIKRGIKKVQKKDICNVNLMRKYSKKEQNCKMSQIYPCKNAKNHKHTLKGLDTVLDHYLSNSIRLETQYLIFR